MTVSFVATEIRPSTCNPEIVTGAILGLLRKKEWRRDIKSTYKH